MDIMPLLDELQTIARNGLFYATDPYDRERYERLMQLVTGYYGEAVDLPPVEVRRRFAAELGYITPKVGADAAIFGDDGRVLLTLRADDHRWCLPCGWVEPNEAPIDTVVRETREETGLEVRPLALIDVFTRLPSVHGGVHTSIAVVYRCEITGGTMGLSHESLDVRYWFIDDVPVWHAEHEEYARAAFAHWQAEQV
ncbi:MAG TPA: NUDIX hydrolase N-terminal domain-containing protein [Herpetosiphonaceae bacterium]|nr:NUDIX hydrolase N-terminal domain-containing protein [Herpetosiphonaceae bacterium]